jgi:hypothetical protein
MLHARGERKCLVQFEYCLCFCCHVLLLPQALPNGHLMNYPIFVTEDGAVGALPGVEDFPDLGGKVLGAKSILPGLLTS